MDVVTLSLAAILFLPGVVSTLGVSGFPPPPSPRKVSGGDNEVTSGEMLRTLRDYVWPVGDRSIRQRVCLSLGLLMGAKVLGTSAPILFKEAVDLLGVSDVSSSPSGALVASSLILGYGPARAGAAGFNELHNVVFVRVAQHSIRKMALGVFRHLHDLDLAFHLSRQTGGLSKTIDRGWRGISTVLNAFVFNIVPTVFELALV